MGPNYDVQKYDPITVFEVLPWYVISLNILPIVTVICNWFTVLFRWWRTGFGGYGRERPQTNFATCEENIGKIRVRYKNYVHFSVLPDVTVPSQVAAILITKKKKIFGHQFFFHN